MTITQTISREALESLGLNEGDTLRVLAVADGSVLVSITHDEHASPRGSVRDWLQSALGSVKLADGETADDVRLEYYAGKYGIGR